MTKLGQVQVQVISDLTETDFDFVLFFLSGYRCNEFGIGDTAKTHYKANARSRPEGTA